MPPLQLLSESDPPGSFRVWLQIAHGIASGIKHLHQYSVWHMDLKLDNVLCTSRPPAKHLLREDASKIRTWQPTPKLADFGLSYKREQGIAGRPSNSPDARGTVSYAAPEICRRIHDIDQDPFTRKVDIWSLGITIAEIWLGCSPWAQLETADSDQHRQSSRASKPAASLSMFASDLSRTLAQLKGDVPEPGSNACWDALETQHEFVTGMIRKCCHPDPMRRPSAAWVVRSLADQLAEMEKQLARN
ncbi:hypothetical protein WJX84_002939 [Apatococcus fuscideae]|uniref:Protein kinase domain-containing protein n=1 Tax=Apatococcus fuscideae TaxID=2026836 RepID=A0AAW1T5W1_9CHLO